MLKERRGARVVAGVVVPVMAAMGIAMSADVARAASVDPGRVTVTGELVRIVDGEDLDTRLRTDNGSYVPVAGAALAGVTPGSVVTIGATATEQAVPIAKRAEWSRNPAQVAAQTGTAIKVNTVAILAAARTSYTPGTHEITAVLLTPSGVSGVPATQDQVRAQIASASTYWSEQTRGGVSFAATKVVGPMNSTATCADPGALWTDAATRAGFVQGPNRHLVVILPKSAPSYGCGYGLGTLGSGPNAGGALYVSDTAWPALAHELGHNMSLMHASRLTCPNVADANLSSYAASVCTVNEYGDPWDVMSASPANNSGSLSTPQAYRVGFLPASDAVVATSGQQDVTLKPVSGLNGVRSLQVTDPRTGQAYYIEYRTRTGRDYLLYGNMTPGVRVLREGPVEYGQRRTIALDASPSGSTADFTWQVAPGSTFSPYGNGFTLRVNSVTADAANVTVAVGAPLTTSTSGPAPVQAPVPTTPQDASLVDINTSTGLVNGYGARGWYGVYTAQYINRTALVTYYPGASWTVSVAGGRTMEILGTAFTQGARALVLVDNRPWIYIDSYRPTNDNPYQQVIGRLEIPAGQHNVTIVALPSGSRDTLALDAYRMV